MEKTKAFGLTLDKMCPFISNATTYVSCKHGVCMAWKNEECVLLRGNLKTMGWGENKNGNSEPYGRKC